MMNGKAQSPFEDTFETTLRFPWWVGVILAISSYLLLHRYAAREIIPPADFLHLGNFLSSESLITLAGYGQYILPAAFLAGSVISVLNNPSVLRVLDYGTCRSNNSAATPQSNIKLQGSHKVSTNPVCPKCGNTMVLRSYKKGDKASGQYWGCNDFPQCRSILGYKK